MACHPSPCVQVQSPPKKRCLHQDHAQKSSLPWCLVSMGSIDPVGMRLGKGRGAGCASFGCERGNGMLGFKTEAPGPVIQDTN